MLILILILSIIGFFVSRHIWVSKKKHEHLTCVIGDKNSCDVVTKSKYNSLFSIPNEINGMMYYGFVAVLSAIMLSGMFLIVSVPLLLILIIAGVIGAAFSVFLIIVQSCVLRQWCEWCLVSALLSIGIFIVEILAF